MVRPLSPFHRTRESKPFVLEASTKVREIVADVERRHNVTAEQMFSDNRFDRRDPVKEQEFLERVKRVRQERNWKKWEYKYYGHAHCIQRRFRVGKPSAVHAVVVARAEVLARVVSLGGTYTVNRVARMFEVAWKTVTRAFELLDKYREEYKQKGIELPQLEFKPRIKRSPCGRKYIPVEGAAHPNTMIRRSTTHHTTSAPR